MNMDIDRHSLWWLSEKAERRLLGQIPRPRANQPKKKSQQKRARKNNSAQRKKAVS